MNGLKRILLVILLLLVLILGILFSIQNSALISLDLLLVELPEQRLALWVLLAFAVGGVIGMLISAFAIIRLRSRLLFLQRKLDKHDKELAKLRTSDLSLSVSKS